MALIIPKINLLDIKKYPLQVLVLITISVAFYFINRNTSDCDKKDITIQVLNKEVIDERRAKDSVTSVLLNVVLQSSDHNWEVNRLKKVISQKDSIINSKLKNPTKDLIKEINKEKK
jgi:hypothetical protein